MKCCVILTACLFTKLPRLVRDSEEIYWFSSQVATSLLVYHKRWKLHFVFFNAERQTGKLQMPIFITFDLVGSRIESRSIVSVAGVRATRPLIGEQCARVYEAQAMFRSFEHFVKIPGRSLPACWFRPHPNIPINCLVRWRVKQFCFLVPSDALTCRSSSHSPVE